MLLDSNILIYAAKPDAEMLRPWLEDPNAMVSIITRIEALGFSRMSPEETAALNLLFGTLPILYITEPVAEMAIELRQSRKIGLADAIIAATALVWDVPLVTRNVQDFQHLSRLRIIDPFAP